MRRRAQSHHPRRARETVARSIKIDEPGADTLVYSLLARYPALRIDLRVEDRLIDLALDNIDIAIRVGADPPLSTEVIAVPLASWARIVVASPAYVAKHGEPSRPADLAKHDALSIVGATIDVWTLIDGTKTARVRLPTRFSTNAGQLLHGAVLDGRGVALLPDWFVADDLKAGRLRHLLDGWTSERTTMLALYRASLRNEKRTKTVIAHLRQAIGQ